MVDTLTDEDISELFLQTGKNGLRRCAKFSGVYMSDELSKLIPEQGKVYIVNLGASNRHNKDGSVGTHWVAISNMLLSSIIYFDSFGAPPNEAILKFLRKAKMRVPTREFNKQGISIKTDPRKDKIQSKRIVYNTMQVQDLDSSACGFFSVYVLKQLMKNRRLIDVIMDLSPFKTWLNDTLVKRIRERNLKSIFPDDLV